MKDERDSDRNYGSHRRADDFGPNPNQPSGDEFSEQPFANDRPERDIDERSGWDRAGDEVLSWLGDDYAQRRRRHDEHRGKGPKNYKRSDDRIKEDLSDKLTDEYTVDASDIEVVVIDGDVILSGYVADTFQKHRAEVIAEAISGVRNVENRIRVQTETPKDNINLMP